MTSRWPHWHQPALFLILGHIFLRYIMVSEYSQNTKLTTRWFIVDSMGIERKWLVGCINTNRYWTIFGYSDLQGIKVTRCHIDKALQNCSLAGIIGMAVGVLQTKQCMSLKEQVWLPVRCTSSRIWFVTFWSTSNQLLQLNLSHWNRGQFFLEMNDALILL